MVMSGNALHLDVDHRNRLLTGLAIARRTVGYMQPRLS